MTWDLVQVLGDCSRLADRVHAYEMSSDLENARDDVKALIAAAQRVLDKEWEYGEDQPHFVALAEALKAVQP